MRKRELQALADDPEIQDALATLKDWGIKTPQPTTTNLWPLFKREKVGTVERDAPKCNYYALGFCAASVDGYCVGGYGDPEDPNCHG